MKLQLAGIALASVLTRAASAQLPSQSSATATPVGTWRGTSLCLVRPSACNDETVVYRITQMKAADSVAIDARKIVRGEEQEMGVLGCRFVRPTGQVTCTLPQGVWHFRVSNDSLTGELRLQDGTRFRDVRTIRAPTHASTGVGPANGTLILDGGPEATPPVAHRFIELAGGDTARIVLIPSAAGDEVARDPATLTQYRQLFGPTCCTILHAKRRAQADSLAFVRSLASATGVWMMGGQPSLLADTYWHTRTEGALRAVLARGGVVGGSSAGATIQGARIPTTNPDHGFAFLRDVFVMAHLDRNNARDMLVRIAREDPRTLGIGVPEHTAAIITGDRLEVLGVGPVVIVDGQDHAGNAFLSVRSGESTVLSPRSIARP